MTGRWAAAAELAVFLWCAASASALAWCACRWGWPVEPFLAALLALWAANTAGATVILRGLP